MSTHNEKNIILVGKTGNGKSSLGNVLLGRRAFTEARSFSAVTKKCQLEKKEGNVSIVDTPGLFDTDVGTSLVKNALEIQRALQLCPNPHAFLIVLNGRSRLTEEDMLTIDVLRIMFGEQCLKKAIIVLTNIENGMDHKKLTYMIKRCSKMNVFIEQCGGMFARIDNKDPRPEHKEYIISLVDQVSKRGTVCFKNEYMNVHKQELSKESLADLNIKPVHLQIKQLSERILQAVEEEMERRLKEEDLRRLIEEEEQRLQAWKEKERRRMPLLSFRSVSEGSVSAARDLKTVVLENPKLFALVVTCLFRKSLSALGVKFT